MILGLDTTVVVRLITGEPAAQAGRARRRLERAYEAGDRILVSDLVVTEAYYALHYHYGIEKDAARVFLRAMLTSGVVESVPDGLESALRTSSGPGLVDRTIVYRYRQQDAITLTLDRKLATQDGNERIR